MEHRWNTDKARKQRKSEDEAAELNLVATDVDEEANPDTGCLQLENEVGVDLTVVGLRDLQLDDDALLYEEPLRHRWNTDKTEKRRKSEDETAELNLVATDVDEEANLDTGR